MFGTVLLFSPARRVVFFLVILLAMSLTRDGSAADAEIPHNQDAPPGPALSPQEAIAKMSVPPGFKVELVACEPMLVNPVAMTFDERGRVWVTESFEYPRREPGPGRDRVKILEDTDGDGRMDKSTIFAEGLNIPSGIAIGYGGVWVANSPDILFLKDTNGDDKADTQEVVVTGFGREDTHELPNSLTWGPDGWLYGLNGVFNPGRVEHQGQVHEFTCTLFRIHPKTRAFELFCEGTSNPWGVAFDPEGNAFISACVIDHLWHLAEDGYYHRQGGPYPPYTWKLESIVKHTHQKAAYCGIHYVSTPAYPKEWRDLLFMGNIHGNCINVDSIEQRESTYFGSPRPDFLTAHDSWFMPVVQKEGPDGCLWILDWYDRYHCYQDANRDPAGIDRAKGRLYRVTYQGTPPAKPFDLSQETDQQLLVRLGGENPLLSDMARRLLAERNDSATQKKLESIVKDENAPRALRLKALWTRVSAGPPDIQVLKKLCQEGGDPALAAHAVRAAGNYAVHYGSAGDELMAYAAINKAPSVRLQAATAIRKSSGIVTEDKIGLLMAVAEQAGDDPLPPRIVWRNLLRIAPDDASFARIIKALEQAASERALNEGLRGMLPSVFDRVLGMQEQRVDALASLLSTLLRDPSSLPLAKECLAQLSSRMQSGEITAAEFETVRQALQPVLQARGEKSESDPLRAPLLSLGVLWGDKQAWQSAMVMVRTKDLSESDRRLLLGALVDSARRGLGDSAVLAKTAAQVAADKEIGSEEFRSQVIAALGPLEINEVGTELLGHFASFDSLCKSRAVDVLCQRTQWAALMLNALEAGKLKSTDINQNQARQMLALKDNELTRRIAETWGTIREGRNPARELVAARMKAFIRNHPGDAAKGQLVFDKVCGQCHKIYGKGQEVGPELTGSGRNSFEQMVSNVFDPSLLIGAAYQAMTVQTTDGRVVTGLLAENSPQRVALKVQGGKLEVIARDQVDEVVQSPLSLMPENLEEQITMDEIADLFAFLVLDRPPSDASAKRLGDIDVVRAERAQNKEAADRLIGEVAPGFHFVSGEVDDVELLEEYQQKRRVLRTHPSSGETPALLQGDFTIPAGKKTALQFQVSAHERGDWLLQVTVNGEKVFEHDVKPKGENGPWQNVLVDLTPHAGKTVTINLSNQATGWEEEWGYWRAVEVVSRQQ